MQQATGFSALLREGPRVLWLMAAFSALLVPSKALFPHHELFQAYTLAIISKGFLGPAVGHILSGPSEEAGV